MSTINHLSHNFVLTIFVQIKYTFDLNPLNINEFFLFCKQTCISVGSTVCNYCCIDIPQKTLWNTGTLSILTSKWLLTGFHSWISWEFGHVQDRWSENQLILDQLLNFFFYIHVWLSFTCHVSVFNPHHQLTVLRVQTENV